jgi:hypothetical protein
MKIFIFIFLLSEMVCAVQIGGFEYTPQEISEMEEGLAQ